MSYSTSNLLLRNLSEVFGENDPVRRRAAIDEMWHEDDVFYDPNKGIYRGRDEIDRIADAIWVTHPDFQYQPIAEPEQLGNGGRVKWVSGHPGELTPGLISSSRETAGFPPFISFSTSYPDLDSAAHDTRMTNVFRHPGPFLLRRLWDKASCALSQVTPRRDQISRPRRKFLSVAPAARRICLRRRCT